MTELPDAIRERLMLHDTGEHTVPDTRCAYDCEPTQAALLAVVELHSSYDTDPCVKLEDGAWWSPEQFEDCETVRLIAKKLGIAP